MNTELGSAETNRKYKNNYTQINKVHLRLPETLERIGWSRWRPVGQSFSSDKI